jgi:hypothetical protein
MLVLNPSQVRFGAQTWPAVLSVVIDRAAAREIVEWSDAGPHAVFADVPEQRVGVRVEMELASDGLDAPRPGDQGELTFVTSPTAADGGRRRASIAAVVLAVRHEVSLRRAVRVIDLVAVSGDGSTDPVVVESEPP